MRVSTLLPTSAGRDAPCECATTADWSEDPMNFANDVRLLTDLNGMTMDHSLGLPWIFAIC
jgi:hypothetical protein